jgi:drug/metabolite transporter superfamily protein YnfA
MSGTGVTTLYAGRQFLRLGKGFQLYLAIDGLDDVFDVAAVCLALQIFGFLANKFVEAGAGELFDAFAGLFLCLHKSFVELVYLLRFIFGL